MQQTQNTVMNYKLPHDKYWVNVFKMEMGKQKTRFLIMSLFICGSSVPLIRDVSRIGEEET